MHISKEEAHKLGEVWALINEAYSIMEDLRPGGGFMKAEEFVRVNPKKVEGMNKVGIDLYAKLRR